jgi:carboxymethylenebutenolidase
VPGDEAARLIIAVDRMDGNAAALALTGAILRAVWVQERNIADAQELASMLSELQLPARRLDDSHSASVRERYDAYTQSAIETGIFGAPSYVIDGEIFWGQDRLDFVQRRLARGR